MSRIHSLNTRYGDMFLQHIHFCLLLPMYRLASTLHFLVHIVFDTCFWSQQTQKLSSKLSFWRINQAPQLMLRTHIKAKASLDMQYEITELEIH